MYRDPGQPKERLIRGMEEVNETKESLADLDIAIDQLPGNLKIRVWTSLSNLLAAY